MRFKWNDVIRREQLKEILSPSNGLKHSFQQYFSFISIDQTFHTLSSHNLTKNEIERESAARWNVRGKKREMQTDKQRQEIGIQFLRNTLWWHKKSVCVEREREAVKYNENCNFPWAIKTLCFYREWSRIQSSCAIHLPVRSFIRCISLFLSLTSLFIYLSK